MAGERDDDDRITRGELHDALRFLHAQGQRGQLELDRIDTVLAALIKTLLETKQLDAARVEQLLPEVSAKLQARDAPDEIAVDIGPAIDKYTVASPTDLDCASLIPLCHARCCRLMFALSFQDLDEGEVRWDYRNPYKIRQGEDGICVHSSATKGCEVYAARPATCRRYDCRGDSRIWEDFERRIPAPLERVMMPTDLVTLRTRKAVTPRMEPSPASDDEPPAT